MDCLRQDGVAGLEEFFGTTFSVPANFNIKQRSRILLCCHLLWEEAIHLHFHIIEINAEVHGAHFNFSVTPRSQVHGHGAVNIISVHSDKISANLDSIFACFSPSGPRGPVQVEIGRKCSVESVVGGGGELGQADPHRPGLLVRVQPARLHDHVLETTEAGLIELHSGIEHIELHVVHPHWVHGWHGELWDASP